jgi:hypothetical protein
MVTFMNLADTIGSENTMGLGSAMGLADIMRLNITRERGITWKEDIIVKIERDHVLNFT